MTARDAALLAAQALGLLWGVLYHGACALLYLPVAVLASLAPRGWKRSEPHKVRFYEGTVVHWRTKPARNAFEYPVRVAVINLDDPPAWYDRKLHDNLTADQARQMTGADGKVLLLTNPAVAGYIQNPISVYYCHHQATGELAACISEVTNTPWGERVTFAFRPDGHAVPKALHVSPLMDMDNSWRLRAPAPGADLHLSVHIDHPTLGHYFGAVLTGRVSTAWPHVRSEHAGLGCLLRYGFLPHRTSLWIYWQAVVLLCKGVPFYNPPDPVYRTRLAEGAASGALGSPPARSTRGAARVVSCPLPNLLSGGAWAWRAAWKAPWSWS